MARKKTQEPIETDNVAEEVVTEVDRAVMHPGIISTLQEFERDGIIDSYAVSTNPGNSHWFNAIMTKGEESLHAIGDANGIRLTDTNGEPNMTYLTTHDTLKRRINSAFTS